MRGNAVEEQQLEEPEPQRRPDRRVELLAPGERVDDVVERAPALDGAVRELARERALARVEAVGLGVQRLVGEGLLLEDAADDAERGAAGGGCRHRCRG